MVRLYECSEKAEVDDDLNTYLHSSSYNSQVMDLEPKTGLIEESTNQTKTASLVGRRLLVPIMIALIRTRALYDTGAQVSLLSLGWLRKNLGLSKADIRSVRELLGHELIVEGVGSQIPLLGYVELKVKIGIMGNEVEVIVPFLVKEGEIQDPIIGTNVMEQLVPCPDQDTVHRLVTTAGLDSVAATAIIFSLTESREDVPMSEVSTLMEEEYIIPACSRVEVKLIISPIMVSTVTNTIFTPNEDWLEENTELEMAETVCQLSKGLSQLITIPVTNNSDEDHIIPSNQILGKLYEVDEVIPLDLTFKEWTEENLQEFKESFGNKTKDTNYQIAEMQTSAGMTDYQTVDSKESVEKENSQAESNENDKIIDFKTVQEEQVLEEDKEFYRMLKELKPEGLSTDELESLHSTIWHERDAFAKSADDIGCVPDLKLHLDTGDADPVVRRYSSIPKPMHKEVQDQIKLMLAKGWIEHSESSWASPIVMVKKKTAFGEPPKFRLCVDYRGLNDVTRKDKHPLPRIQESLDNLQGSCIYSTLDFSRAYYQGFVDEESRAKTAFTTPWGFYQWRRIPFGLTNAVPLFQRYMESTLAEFRETCCIPYLDDTIVHSKTNREHINQLGQVLKKFKSKGLKLNITKCQFFKKEVSYLGRVVSSKGYKMDERSILAVKELANREYKTVGEVRQLMGLLNFHRRFVQDFAKIAKPITDLLADDSTKSDEKPKTSSKDRQQSDTVKKVRKGGGVPSKKPIVFGDLPRKALIQLVTIITSWPILAYPDFDKTFRVHTDASGHGLGAILYQHQEEEYRVIAYASRSLKPAEANYHSSKLEFMALKYAVTEQFRQYLLYADHFYIFTDNNPLLWVMSNKKSNASIQRWISELQEFHFSIKFRPGVINADADCLSRLPLQIEKYQHLCKEETSIDIFNALVAEIDIENHLPVGSDDSDELMSESTTSQDTLRADSNDIEKLTFESETYDKTEEFIQFAALKSVTNQKEEELGEVRIAEVGVWDLVKEQAEEGYIIPILEEINNQIPNTTPLSEESKILRREMKQLYIDENGILRRNSPHTSQGQVVLPLHRRREIYEMLHCNAGHLGAERVLKLARERVFWPKMKDDIEHYVQDVCVCLSQRSSRKLPVAPLQSVNTNRPLDLVSIDYLHLEPSIGGYEYILAVIDNFSRFTQSYPCKDKTAKSAAKHLYGDYIMKFGIPGRLLHDQGREFENNLFRDLNLYCGIVRSRTTPYHPQTNGMVERFNSTLLQMLRTLPELQKPRWSEQLPKLMFAYNTSTHASTGYSPFKLMFGRQPILPVDWLLQDHIPRELEGIAYHEYMDQWSKDMDQVYNVAKNNIDKARKQAQDRWAKKSQATELEVGDHVLVKNKRDQGGPGKIRSKWETEIYSVIEKKEGGVVYVVKGLTTGEERVLHRTFMILCNDMETIPSTWKEPSSVTTPMTLRSNSSPQADNSATSEEDDVPLIVQRSHVKPTTFEGNTASDTDVSAEEFLEWQQSRPPSGMAAHQEENTRSTINTEEINQPGDIELNEEPSSNATVNVPYEEQLVAPPVHFNMFTDQLVQEGRRESRRPRRLIEEIAEVTVTDPSSTATSNNSWFLNKIFGW